eukprot:6214527-Pleurochrysis_carterae.AAC.4
MTAAATEIKLLDCWNGVALVQAYLSLSLRSVASSGVSEIIAQEPASSGADGLSQAVSSQRPSQLAAPAAEAMANPDILEQSSRNQPPGAGIV